MKIKDLVAFLQTLDQEALLLEAKYYYEDREGFVETDVTDLPDLFVKPEDTRFYRDYKDKAASVYLFDQQGGIRG